MSRTDPRPPGPLPARLRVLHVVQPTDAGAARCAADFSADQQRRGWDVSVACPADGPLRSWLEDLGVPWVAWEARREPGPGVGPETRRLAGVVRSAGPDVVHLHSAKAGLAGRLAIRGRVPTVFQPHAWSFDAAGGVVRFAAVRWERLATRWTDLIVCVSDAERLAGEGTGIRARYRVIPNGVDLTALTETSASERSAARRRLGLGSGPVVVAVGRLSRQKGQDVLLDAWPEVCESVAEARLYLVGDGPEREALEGRRVSGVHFVGRRDDVPDWLAAADVVAVPSRWEGMALTVLEAMARGRTVVASDVSGVRESLGDEAGAIVPPEDSTGLAAALVARLREPMLAEAEGRAGRERVERRHDLRLTTERVAAAYGDVLEARRAAPA